MTTTLLGRLDLDLSIAVTWLMKGVVYRDTHDKPWAHVVGLQPQVSDFVRTMGLELVIDDAEGYAFLRQRPDIEDSDDSSLPRLVPRRSLSFPVSILLALLRKRLAEFDSSSSDTRLVLTRDEVVEMMRVFLPTSINDARLVDQIDTHLGKVVDLGFVRRITDQGGVYEVRRILKAFVDAQWLADLDQRLAAYAGTLAHDENVDS